MGKRIQRILWTSCLSGALVTCASLAFAEAEVKVSYDYGVKPKPPTVAGRYCLDVTAPSGVTSLSRDDIASACSLAASVKGYRVNVGGDDCQKISMMLSVKEDSKSFLKRIQFQFFELSSGLGSQPQLTALSELSSAHDQFNDASIVASCRAIFEYFPDHSSSSKVVARTDLDDVVDGNGLYVLGDLMFNGYALTGGYFKTSELAFEAGYEELKDSLNFDAQRSDKFFFQARYFPSRRFYVTGGAAIQRVAFSRNMVYQSDSLIFDSQNSRNVVNGSLMSAGMAGSLGFLLKGKSHHKGGLFGVDVFGFYAPQVILFDNIRIQKASDDSFRGKAARKISKQNTYYLLRLNVGYAF